MDHLAALPAEARKLALARFRLIQPHLEQARSLSSVAQTAGISYRTRTPLGYAISPVRSGRTGTQAARGSRRAPDRVDEAPRVYRRAGSTKTAPADRRVVPPGRALGAEAWRARAELRDGVQHRSPLGADLVLLAHEGSKAYSETFELVHRRVAAESNATQKYLKFSARPPHSGR
jgi:putative transposase